VATQLPATQGLAFKILLIEDNPREAAWTASMLKQQFPRSEVEHSTSVADGLSVLAQRRVDVVFIGVRPDGRKVSTNACRRLVRRARGKPVVAVVNPAAMEHAADIHATGVYSVYCKYARWAAQAGLPPWSLSRSWVRREARAAPTRHPSEERNPVPPI
jgi:CheY-like chemotaxis protein